MRNAVTQMDKEVKQLLNNPKVLYSVAAILSVLLIGSFVGIYGAVEHNKDVVDFDNIKIDIGDNNNYVGLIKLGLAPNTFSRQPQKNDIDTGIKLKDGDNIYSLIESRTWVTKDYGKTFLVRVY